MYGWKSTTSLQEADWVTMLKRTSLRCVGTATGACIKISLLTYQVHLLLTDLIPPEDERQGVGQRLPYHPPVDRQLLATPWIVPVPCSYSYRICSNSSTLALKAYPLPGRQPGRPYTLLRLGVGPNQCIEIMVHFGGERWTGIRVAGLEFSTAGFRTPKMRLRSQSPSCIKVRPPRDTRITLG